MKEPDSDQRRDYVTDICYESAGRPLDDFLNNYAKNGWELHTIQALTLTSGSTHIYFCTFQRLTLDERRLEQHRREFERRGKP